MLELISYMTKIFT